jgi:hypothetical protein
MAEADGELLETLKALELALHQPPVRRDAARLDALLHADFVEFGRSGRVWHRADILTALLQEADGSTPLAQDFALKTLGPDAALLTYRSTRPAPTGGGDVLHSLRSSLWRRGAQGWQLMFHQGTPCGPAD